MPKATMKARGWGSENTARAALQELVDSGLIVVSRRGDRRRCHLYAITLWPLACDLSKLTIKPAAYALADWSGEDRSGAAEPTEMEPATWRSLRPRAQNQSESSRGGCITPDIQPQRQDSSDLVDGYASAAAA